MVNDSSKYAFKIFGNDNNGTYLKGIKVSKLELEQPEDLITDWLQEGLGG